MTNRMVELAIDFRQAKVNPYWPNIMERPPHGLHNMGIMLIAMMISRDHQFKKLCLSIHFLLNYLETLPQSNMVKIAVAGGSGRMILFAQQL